MRSAQIPRVRVLGNVVEPRTARDVRLSAVPAVVELGNSSTGADAPKLPRTRPNGPLTGSIHNGMSARAIAGVKLAEEGRRLLEQQRYLEALVRFERALALYPSPYVYHYLGQVHYRRGQYQQAAEFFEVAESLFAADDQWRAEAAAWKDIARNEIQSSRAPLAARDLRLPAVRTSPASVAEAESVEQTTSIAVTERSDDIRTTFVLVDLLMIVFAGSAFFIFWWLDRAANLTPLQHGK